MAHIIELPLAAGGSVLFEVEDLPTAKTTYRGGAPAMIEQVGASFETVIGKLKPVAEAIAAELSSLVKAPDSLEVEFGIKLTADAGVVIAKAGSEASLRIKLGWSKA